MSPCPRTGGGCAAWRRRSCGRSKIAPSRASADSPPAQPVYTAPAARPGFRVDQTIYVSTLRVELGSRSYPILIGGGLLARADRLAQHVPGRHVLLVTNTTVGP